MNSFFLFKRFVRKVTQCTMHSWYRPSSVNFWCENIIWSQPGRRLISRSKAPGIMRVWPLARTIEYKCPWYAFPINWTTSNQRNLISLAIRHHECLAASGRKTSLVCYVNNFSTGEYKEFDSRLSCLNQLSKVNATQPLLHLKSVSSFLVIYPKAQYEDK